MNMYDETLRWFLDADHWQGVYGVPHRFLEHLEYTALTMIVASAIAIPLGLWIGHTGTLRQLAVSGTGAMRALPTLGLLTWVVLWQGVSIGPVIAVLVILAVPPVLAGTYSGLESVDRLTVDAARSMGMTEWQILWRVEVPIAMPLIIGGVRSAIVQVVATATVAAYVGVGGLGRFLIDGIAVQEYPPMLAGSLVAVFLALALDGLSAVVQRVVSGEHVRLEANASV